MPGEHDAALDQGKVYQENFGATRYSFDHKGIHFTVLDNVSDPQGAIGDTQMDWLLADLNPLRPQAPIVVFTHRPLFDLAPAWGWATRDGSKAIYVLRPLGRVEEGVTVAAKATRLDPLNGRVWTTLASFLVSAGRLDEARAAAERSLEVNPEQAFAPGWLGFILLLQGQPTAALQVSARSTNEVFRLMNEASDDVMMRSLRNDPRYDAFLKELNLRRP
jgi:tetratricopeptide (TPR) repeat protein